MIIVCIYIYIYIYMSGSVRLAGVQHAAPHEAAADLPRDLHHLHLPRAGLEAQTGSIGSVVIISSRKISN